ncbi:SDR family NAD(P)-dependent oxidoreductase [Actinomadura sp. LOL_016]|uniref:SDR family NAD(P)-dependent oxidoreductase n=1 Tax=unclassified Actinomadura TaxID=2626254 RepID=UPI003A7F6530
MGSMDGRVALVTGASRGIGQYIAERFADEGASVALVARTVAAGTSPLPGSLEEVVARIRAKGGRVEAIRADLTVPDDVETVVERAEAALGPLDTLVNNAGVNFYGPALDVRPRRYALMFQMMVHSPFRLCQLAVPGMVERGRGWVLNITSKQARHPMGPPYPDWASDGCVAYGMCKAALDRLTTGLAAELDGSGVSVNSLGTSGLVMTPGVAVVSPHTPDNAPVEDSDAMAEAALALCGAAPGGASGGVPGAATGRIAYSMELLGRPFPEGPWALSATF